MVDAERSSRPSQGGGVEDPNPAKGYPSKAFGAP